MAAADYNKLLHVALEKHSKDIDDAVYEYLDSICSGLVDERCFDVDEWLSRISPHVADEIENEESVRSACQEIIDQVQPNKGGSSGKEKPDTKPSSFISIEPLTLLFMGKLLLSKTKLVLQKGLRYGLVGENGAGKTTFMKRLAAGELPGFPQTIKICYVQHEIVGNLQDKSVTAFMQDGNSKVDPQRIKAILDGVGFSAEMQKASVAELSGGWRMKLALARSMLVQADILLLDEPTNHLDRESVMWLKNYLVNAKDITIIVVSHEPEFLDAVATNIILIKDQALHYYEGNFEFFQKQQGAFTLADLKKDEARKQRALLLTFKFPNPGWLVGVNSKTRTVLKMTDVSFSYGKDKTVLSNVSIKLSLSSRVAVVGRNGAGKSTLVKLLVGEVQPEGDARVWKHHNLRVAYVAQHSFFHIEQHMDSTPLLYIQERFKLGTDKESSENKAMADEGDEPPKWTVKPGMKVEAIMGRRKFKHSLAYEIKWIGFDDEDNTWVPLKELEAVDGAMKLVHQFDERLRGRAAGIDQRPLTNTEVINHLADFGLQKQYAMGKIAALSGGQRSRLVLAAAMWNKPHLLMLDEPTNYLDHEALAALSRAIAGFEGAVLLVSHHDLFVRDLCPEIWRIDQGRLAIENAPDDKRPAASTNSPGENQLGAGIENKTKTQTQVSANEPSIQPKPASNNPNPSKTNPSKANTAKSAAEPKKALGKGVKR